jgi:HEAT repeat protein
MDKVERDLQKLHDKDKNVLQRALGRLAKSDDERAKAGLTKLLEIDDEDLRLLGIKAAEKMQNKEAVPTLIRILQDPESPYPDRLIIEVLGTLGDSRAVPYIIPYLERTVYYDPYAPEALGKIGVSDEQLQQIIDLLSKSSSKSERSGAAMALGEIGDKRAVPALLAALNDEKEVCAEAAKALGKLDAKEALPALFKLVDSKEWDVRYNSFIAIGRIGTDDEQFNKLVLMLKEGSYESARALSNIKTERSAKALVDEFTNNKINREATKAVSKIGEAAVPVLIKALDHKDYKVRHRAAEALGLIGDSRASKALIKEMENGTIVTKRKSIVALGRIKDPKAVDALIKVLKSGNEEQRKLAAQALGRIKSPKAVRPLIAAASDPDDHVKYRALEALGAIKDKRAIPALLRLGAMWAVARIGLNHLDQRNRIKCMFALGRAGSLSKMGKRVIPYARRFQKSQELQDRMTVVRFLNSTAKKKHVHPSIFPMLKIAFQDSEHQVGDQAVEGLGSLVGKEKRVLRFLKQQLSGNDQRSKELAVDALASAAQKGADVSSAFELLFQVLGSDSQPLRNKSATALAQAAGQEMHQGNILRMFADILSGDDQHAKEAVTNSLSNPTFKKCDITHLLDPLFTDLCYDQAEERKKSVGALTHLIENVQNGQEVLARLISLLQDKNPNAQEGATQILDKIVYREVDLSPAIDPLLKLLVGGSQKAQDNAAEILERIASIKKKSKVIIPKLIGLLERNDLDIQVAAVSVLAKVDFSEADVSPPIDPIFRVLVEGSEKAQDNAARTLAKVTSSQKKSAQILPRLVGLLEGNDSNAQVGAVKVFAKVNPREMDLSQAIDLLLKVLVEELPEAKEIGAQALARIATDENNCMKAINRLFHFLSGNNPQAQEAAAILYAKSCKLYDFADNLDKFFKGSDVTAPIVLIKKLILELPISPAKRSIEVIINNTDSVEKLDELRNEIVTEVRETERFREPDLRKEAAELMKVVNARKNELLVTDINVERKSMKPPSGQSHGGYYRFGRILGRVKR